MRPRILLTGGILGASTAVMLVVAACSFPDIAFAPASLISADGSLITNDGQSTTDGSSTADGPVTPVDGGNPDGNPCVTADPCDCDGDGDPSITCDGGKDCDDKDGRIRSTQMDFIDAAFPRPGSAPDWNCDQNVEQHGKANLNCANAISGTIDPLDVEAKCLSFEGFQADPKCAEIGVYYQCERAGDFPALTCRIKPGTVINVARGCR